ncbi:MAG: N-acetyltransferase family protein [Actinomycetota bacterium]
MHVRLARMADAEALCAIYNRAVESSTATLDLTPRTVEQQQAYLAHRSGGLAVVVAETAPRADAGTAGTDDETVEPEIAGFASLSFYRDRAGYRTSVEDSIYVADEHQGTGVGGKLLAELITIASNRGFHCVFARIVDAQPASMALHTRHGFELVGIEREVARKFGRWHDVALMQRML